MNGGRFIILFIILAMSIPYTYGGCVVVFTSGDIETEKDSEGSDTATVFTGRTIRAVIDSTNVKALSGGAFAGGITRFEAASAGFKQDSRATQIGAFRPLWLPLILQDSLQKVETASTIVDPFRPAVETKRGTLQGGCGGKLSYSIDFIGESKSYNGNFSFDNYCAHGIAISGETDIDGAYRVDSRGFFNGAFFFCQPGRRLHDIGR